MCSLAKCPFKYIFHFLLGCSFSYYRSLNVLYLLDISSLADIYILETRSFCRNTVSQSRSFECRSGLPTPRHALGSEKHPHSQSGLAWLTRFRRSQERISLSSLPSFCWALWGPLHLCRLVRKPGFGRWLWICVCLVLP